MIATILAHRVIDARYVENMEITMVVQLLIVSAFTWFITATIHRAFWGAAVACTAGTVLAYFEPWWSTQIFNVLGAIVLVWVVYIFSKVSRERPTDRAGGGRR